MKQFRGGTFVLLMLAVGSGEPAVAQEGAIIGLPRQHDTAPDYWTPERQRGAKPLTSLIPNGALPRKPAEQPYEKPSGHPGASEIGKGAPER